MSYHVHPFGGIRTLTSTTVLSVQLTASSPSLFHLGQQGHIHLFCVWCPQVSPHGLGHLETMQAVRLESRSAGLYPVHETTWLWRKLHPKFSSFSVRVQACCTGLPARLPIKEILGEPGLQSAAIHGLCHTPCEHNLNYTIWTLWTSGQCHTPLGRAHSNLSSNLVRAHSNLSSNLGRAHSNLSSNLGRAHSNLSSTLGRTHSKLSNNLGRGLSNLSSNLGPPSPIYQATWGMPSPICQATRGAPSPTNQTQNLECYKNSPAWASEDTCTSVALDSCLSSSKPRYCWVCVALKDIRIYNIQRGQVHFSNACILPV
jgi:hypothetical protein